MTPAFAAPARRGHTNLNPLPIGDCLVKRFPLLLAAAVLAVGPTTAHDTWVQANTNVVRTGEAVHIDLMLGNHGNDHRDFKLASKLPGEAIQTFAVRGPDGKTTDLKAVAADVGLTAKDGYHSAKFVAAKPGVHVAYQASDAVVNHGKPTRSIRSAKTVFLASDSLDKVPPDATGFDAPLGHPLELVPTANPVAPMGPGKPIRVQLLHNGKPLEGVRVSFVPRGVTLKEGADADHERTTDAEGKASWTPKTGNVHLVVARHATTESGDKYEATQYAATLVVIVPEK